jgi:hypothetical protein
MITYQEFLVNPKQFPSNPKHFPRFQPSLLGNRLTRHMPPYSGYRPETEPAIAVEFAAGAYRLHGLIRVSQLKIIWWISKKFPKKEFYQLADPNFRKIGDVRFVSNAGSVELILRTGTDQLIRFGCGGLYLMMVSALLRGLMMISSKKPQRLAPAVTEVFWRMYASQLIAIWSNSSRTEPILKILTIKLKN